LVSSTSYASATIVNAIGLGKGGAFAIGLPLKANVRLEGGPSEIIAENDFLKLCAKKALAQLGSDSGLIIEVSSEIPIARGLGSSSAVSNAVVSATLKALGEHLPPLAVIDIAVRASIEAGVSITGAFDDAAASFLGGGVLTDNTENQLLKSFELPDYRVMICVPEEKLLTSSVPVERMKLLKPFISPVWDMAFQGRVEDAMVLNGFSYSAVLGYDPKVIIDCLDAGARAAAIAGKGPAIVALVERARANDVASVLEGHGKVLECGLVRKRDDI